MIDIVLQAMSELSYSAEQILAVVQKMEAIKREKARAASAGRQRAFRQRNACNDVTHVTRDSVTEGSAYKETAHTRALIPVGISNDIPPIVLTPLVPPNDPPAPRQARRAKARSSISENYQIDEKHREISADYGLTAEQAEAEFRRFRNHHVAVGSLMANWHAAWAKWCANINKFTPINSNTIAKPKERDLRGVPDNLLSADDYWRKRKQQREWA